MRSPSWSTAGATQATTISPSNYASSRWIGGGSRLSWQRAPQRSIGGRCTPLTGIDRSPGGSERISIPAARRRAWAAAAGSATANPRSGHRGGWDAWAPNTSATSAQWRVTPRRRCTPRLRLDAPRPRRTTLLRRVSDRAVSLPVNAFHARMETARGVVPAPDEVLTAALGGFVRRAVINSASVPVDVGRKRRLFTGVARDVALALKQCCDHPGCSVPAAHCDADHVDEWWRDDGRTNLDNLGPRCRAHNSWKHHEGLWVRYDAEGRVCNMRADGSLMRPVGQPPPAIPVFHGMPAHSIAYELLRPRHFRCVDRGSSDDDTAAEVLQPLRFLPDPNT